MKPKINWGLFRSDWGHIVRCPYCDSLLTVIVVKVTKEKYIPRKISKLNMESAQESLDVHLKRCTKYKG